MKVDKRVKGGGDLNNYSYYLSYPQSFYSFSDGVYVLVFISCLLFSDMFLWAVFSSFFY